MKDKLIDFGRSATRGRPSAPLGMIGTTPVVYQTLGTVYCRPSALSIADHRHCLLQTIGTVYCRPSALSIADHRHFLLQTIGTSYCRPSALPTADPWHHLVWSGLPSAQDHTSFSSERIPSKCHMPNHGSNLVENLGRKNADLF